MWVPYFKNSQSSRKNYLFDWCGDYKYIAVIINSNFTEI